MYPIPRGVSYNSYVLLDEKTVLLDTVDRSVSGQFLENLEHVLAGRSLDYLIVNHMEPDHCALIADIVLRYPEVKIVGNTKTFGMIRQFFDFNVDSRAVMIKEGDTLSTGKHTLFFAMIPMVHWPEAMVTYDAYDKVLFSADAFGTFGALNGNIFADEVDFENQWLEDARRYLTNIVGKYGAQVQAALKKALTLDILAGLLTNTRSGAHIHQRIIMCWCFMALSTEIQRMQLLSLPVSWLMQGRRILQCMMFLLQILLICCLKHFVVTGSYLHALPTMEVYSLRWRHFFMN